MRRFFRSACLASIAIAIAVPAASATPSVTGAFDGSMTYRTADTTSVASAILDQTGKRIDGTVIVARDGQAPESYAVRGRARGRRVTLKGRSGSGTKLKWRARWKGRTALRGKLMLRSAGSRATRGVLTLVPHSTTPDTCDAYFRDTVMAEVLVPVCAQCHVAGGAAAISNFHVSVDDPDATRQSVEQHIDLANPSASRLLQKSIGGLGHGGGPQIAADGPQYLVLQDWVAMVAGAQCGAGPDDPGAGGGDPGSGGGDPGGDGSGAALYAAHCASCHGTDARGLAGRPDIHCHKSIHDSVRNGLSGPLGEMPPFPSLTDADIEAIQGYLESLCPIATATGDELYASNCAACHGATGSGGRNGAGVRGPDIRCTESHDFIEKVTKGEDEMPAFPDLDADAISRIVDFVHGFCADSIGAFSRKD